MLAMVPGMSAKLGSMDVDESQLGKIEAIIHSMTPEERSNPDLLNPSRKKRIAAGAGVPVSQVNRLAKQLEQMKKLMKQFGGKMPGMPGMPGGRRGRLRFPF